MPSTSRQNGRGQFRFRARANRRRRWAWPRPRCGNEITLMAISPGSLGPFGFRPPHSRRHGGRPRSLLVGARSSSSDRASPPLTTQPQYSFPCIAGPRVFRARLRIITSPVRSEPVAGPTTISRPRRAQLARRMETDFRTGCRAGIGPNRGWSSRDASPARCCAIMPASNPASSKFRLRPDRAALELDQRHSLVVAATSIALAHLAHRRRE